MPAKIEFYSHIGGVVKPAGEIWVANMDGLAPEPVTRLGVAPTMCMWLQSYPVNHMLDLPEVLLVPAVRDERGWRAMRGGVMACGLHANYSPEMDCVVGKTTHVKDRSSLQIPVYIMPTSYNQGFA